MTLLKHQLVIINRSRQRPPNLPCLDRFVLGLTTLFVSRCRIAKVASILSLATLFKFHNALINRKYRLLFSSSAKRRKPGPKGPSAELIAAIIEIKSRNPKFGCVRIAQQISYAFGVEIDKDVVRRVLAKQPARRFRIERAFLADFHRADEGQPLEPRSVSL